jgi:nitroreductase
MVGGHAAPDSMHTPSGPPSELPEWARVSTVAPEKAAKVVPHVKPVSSVMMSEDGGRGAAQRLGDYGAAPSEWYKTPLYAYHVKMRQRDLRHALAARRADLEKAQSAADDALVVLAERVRPTVHHKDAYAKLLDAIIVAERTLKERDSELAAAIEAHKRQTAGLDAKITEHEAELGVARAEERAREDVFNRADEIRQRAEAKIKRIDIELRSAVARASAAGAGVPGMRAADVAASDPEVQAKTAEREARVAEVEQAMPAVTDSAQKLTVARKKVTGIEQKMMAVKNERAALEERFKRSGAAHGAQVAKAQKDVRVAMVALGRAAAADHGTFGDEWTEARTEIAALDKVTAARDDEVMIHVMALDAHDAETVKKGMTLIGAAAAALLLLLALPFLVRFATAATAPPPPPPSAATPD